MYNSRLIFVIIVINYLPKLDATLLALKESMDLSNVNLINYNYFKNLPSQRINSFDISNAGGGEFKLNSLMVEYFQKKKAILDYFENLLFGNSQLIPSSEIEFNPYFGRAWHPYYAKKYGWRGECLIEALGKGYSLAQLRKYDAISKDYGYS